jgi:hypothetical protein
VNYRVEGDGCELWMNIEILALHDAINKIYLAYNTFFC